MAEHISATISKFQTSAWCTVAYMRFGLMTCLEQNSTQPTIHMHARASGKLTPDKKDRDAWWAFISGRSEAEWNPPKKPKQNKSSRYAKEQRYSGGMRAFAEDSDVHEDAAVEDNNDQTYEFLPTLSNTSGLDREPHTKRTVLITREPTPNILRDIDHVCDAIFE